jgi:hypothetical protein
MANAYVIAYVGGMFKIRAMDTGAILHIYFVAHFYVMHIATHNCIEPKTALVAGGNVTNDGGVRCDKTIGAELGRKSFYGKNDGHYNGKVELKIKVQRNNIVAWKLNYGNQQRYNVFQCLFHFFILF